MSFVAVMENEAALMSGTEDLLALICCEEGFFQGYVDDEGDMIVDPFKTFDGVLKAQQFAIIQETTQIIWTKTLALTGQRLEEAKQASSLWNFLIQYQLCFQRGTCPQVLDTRPEPGTVQNGADLGIHVSG